MEDPADPSNHCARVIIRSDEQAIAAGNRVEVDGKMASWDCQFFIYATQTIPEGMEVKMTLKVKAEKAGHFETQAHYAPGDYNHYQLFGNVDYGTEWKEVSATAIVDANHTQNANGKYFQSVAFNLSTMTDGNVIYFDDVKLEIREQEKPHEFSEWLNIVRNGVKSKDEMTFANGTFTTFTGRDGVPGIDQPARIVTDPLGVEPVLSVSSVAATYMRENKDEEGNVTGTTPMYVVREGNLNSGVNVGDSVELTNWQSQFFVSHKHVFHTGQKVKFAIDARADHPTDIETQIHRGPGDYLHYQLFGNLALTEEWQHFEFEQDITAEQNGGSTVAFNLNVYKDADNTYYFKNIEFSCNEADASEEERTIASEDVVLPVAPSKDEADATHTSVSLKGAKDALLLDDVIGLISDDNMKLQTADGTLSEEFYTPEVGFYLNQDGSANGEEGDFIIEVAEDEEAEAEEVRVEESEAKPTESEDTEAESEEADFEEAEFEEVEPEEVESEEVESEEDFEEDDDEEDDYEEDDDEDDDEDQPGASSKGGSFWSRLFAGKSSDEDEEDEEEDQDYEEDEDYEEDGDEDTEPGDADSEEDYEDEYEDDDTEDDDDLMSEDDYDDEEEEEERPSRSARRAESGKENSGFMGFLKKLFGSESGEDEEEDYGDDEEGPVREFDEFKEYPEDIDLLPREDSTDDAGERLYEEDYYGGDDLRDENRGRLSMQRVMKNVSYKEEEADFSQDGIDDDSYDDLTESLFDDDDDMSFSFISNSRKK